MDVRFIAVIKNTNDEIIGYRIMDVSVKKPAIKDVPVQSMLSVLKSKGNIVDGLCLNGAEIEGSNGSISRYPVIVNGALVGKSPLVILTQYEVNGVTIAYKASDWAGRIVTWPIEKVLKYAKENGIANGKVTVTANGNEIISSIKESYKKEEVQVAKKAKITINTDIDIDFDPWSIETFKEYMKENYYSYKLEQLSSILLNADIEYRLSEVDSTIRVLKVPIGVQQLDMNTFSDIAKNLEVLILPPTIKVISESFCAHAKKLKKVIFADGTTKIYASGIRYSLIKELKLPDTVTHIEGFPFNDNLETVDISNTNAYGIEYFLHNCPNLKEVKLPKTLTVIGNNCFQSTALTSIDWSYLEKLEVIFANTCSKCDKLQQVILPDNLRVIYNGAFATEHGIGYIKIPKNISLIESLAFNNSRMETLELPSAMQRYSCIGLDVDKAVIRDTKDVSSISIGCFSYSSIKNVECCDSITVYQSNAFRQCGILESVRLSLNTEVIEDKVFYLCTKLKYINIRELSKLKSIKESAFYGCTSLESIILPDGLTSIYDEAFANCTNLKYIVIPASVTGIGKNILKEAGIDRALDTVVYVYPKSKALAYCRRRGIRYRLIHSLDEVFEQESEPEERVIDTTKASKLKLALGANQLHSELFTPYYENYADILYTMYNRLTQPYKPDSAERLKLDTSKYIEAPITVVKMLENVYTIKTGGSVLEGVQENAYDEVLSERFKSLSNLITGLFELTPNAFSEGSLKYLEEECEVQSVAIYADKYSMIIRFAVTEPRCETPKYNILTIIIGGSIKFVCGYRTPEFKGIEYGIFNKDYSYGGEAHYPLSKIVDKNDIISAYARREKTSHVQGTSVPAYINRLLIAALQNEIIILSKPVAERTDSTDAMSKQSVKVLCLETGQVFEAFIFIREGRDIRSISMNHCVSLGIKSQKSYLYGNKKELASIAERFRQHDAEAFFKTVGFGQRYKDIARNKDNSYDDVRGVKEWENAKEIHLKGIDYDKSVDYSEHLLVLNSYRFGKERAKLESRIDRIDISYSKLLNGGDYSFITGYDKRKKGFVSFIVKAGGSGYSDTYYSVNGFKTEAAAIKALYDPSLKIDDTKSILRLRPAKKELVYISGNYHKLIAEHNPIYLGLAIDKTTGKLLLAGSPAGFKYDIPLMAFKGWDEVNNFLQRASDKESEEYREKFDIIPELVEAVMNISDARYDTCTTRYDILRAELIDGISNNEMTKSGYTEIFKIVFKSPDWYK